MNKIIFRILCSNFIGKIISLLFNYNIPNIRYGCKRFLAPKDYCNNKVRAMIFFGFYESAEMRLVQKNLDKSLPIIELGSSLGIVSATTNQFLKNNVSYTCIEANPHLINYIEQNIKKHNPEKTNFKVINAAIAYNTNGTIQMNISNNNTESSLIKEINTNNTSLVTVPAISLNSLTSQPYTLICDIEGAEIDILINDAAALKNCKNLLIELHQTSYNNVAYSVIDLKNQLINEHGFSLKINDGNVFYFEKK